MSAKKQGQFQIFGRLDTWIVGLQYYEGAAAANEIEVFFERDPDNPFDPNAIAVLSPRGIKLGHLPKYDAEYFSQLMLDGLVALKGHTGTSKYGDRVPLALTIYATSKVSEILKRDQKNDWRSIYHNTLVDVWRHRRKYTPETLEEFRSRFRPLAHEEPLYPKTQFLYRMLKAYINDRREDDKNRLRDTLLRDFKRVQFGPLMGWPELTVIPLYPPDHSFKTSTAGKIKTTALATVDDSKSSFSKQIVSRCPYPKGARGIAIFAYDTLCSLDWFNDPATARIFWFERIIKVNLNDIDCDCYVTEPGRKTPKALKATIVDILKYADCSLQNNDDGTSVVVALTILNNFSGKAVYHNGTLQSLTLARPNREDTGMIEYKEGGED